MTNIGTFIADRRQHIGGHSFFATRSIGHPDPLGARWPGTTWIFGKLSDKARSIGYAWTHCQQGALPADISVVNHVAALRTPGNHTDIAQALIQQFEILPSECGEAAWTAGRLLAMRSGTQIEEL